jgi:hypothetical protein
MSFILLEMSTYSWLKFRAVECSPIDDLQSMGDNVGLLCLSYNQLKQYNLIWLKFLGVFLENA